MAPARGIRQVSPLDAQAQKAVMRFVRALARRCAVGKDRAVSARKQRQQGSPE
jgi:hypothetical protein